MTTEAFRQYRIDQARNYLEQVSGARRHIEALNARADELRSLADGIRGIAYDTVRVEVLPYADKIPDAVADLVELSERAMQDATDYAAMVDECSVALASLGGWKADLLDLHYLGGKTLVEIGGMDGWKHDRFYMSSLHVQALDAFYDHMPYTGREPLHPAI